MTDWTELPSHPTLGLARHDGAVRVEFRRPASLNAFDTDMSAALLAILGDLGQDDSVRSVLITGTGRAFSAGADINTQFGAADARGAIEQGLRELTNTTITAIRQMPKPVIAAVNGPAAGVGCSLALSCDLVVASESAFFLLAFANLGLTADGGSSLLVPARVGLGRAFVMTLLAERVPATEALSWGLADRVVPGDELDRITEELAIRLAAGPTLSYAATKQLINRSVLGGLVEQLDMEATMQGKLVQTADFIEGSQAFAEKRAPRFEAR